MIPDSPGRSPSDAQVEVSHTLPIEHGQVPGYLEMIRRTEVESVRQYFRAGCKVLELGGGNGFQAAMLAAWGCDVTSLDVPGRPKYERSYFSVQDYDGSAIPFPDGTFDVVFSSNVLEHVREPAALVRETRRVLKRGGIAVHLMPSTAWRFWTSVAHYVYLAKYIAGKREVASAPAAPTAAAVVRRRGWRYLFWRALLAGPHGEYSNAVAELYYFSSRRWSRLLRDNGFQVEVVAPSGLFYTGYSLLPALPVGMRRRLSTFLGSACNIFVVAPVPDPLPGGSSSFEKTGSDGSTPEIRPMREQRQ